MPMVSPGNTFVCLTESSPTLCKPDEPDVYFPTGKRNYLRVVPNDAVQGAGLASFADESGIRKPYILFAAADPTSKGQADTFEGAARSLGMQIAGSEQWDPKATELHRPDEEGEGLRRGRRAARRAARGERRAADQGQGRRCSGRTTARSSCSLPTASPSRTRSSRRAPRPQACSSACPARSPEALTGSGSVFVNELRAQLGDQPIEVFAPYAGEAAEVLINAIREGGTRTGTIDALFTTRVTDGITGSFLITPSGDPSPAPISVQQAGDTFTLAKTIVPQQQLIDAARGKH